ncbi:SAM-dependent methyltransferase [Sorangium sp. So ce367]|uniref:SAM-dependent methyltransferase n=1 Tax=Sorangium sp. So ce367 TaxID=3133305 RepID=UPI003F62B2C9
MLLSSCSATPDAASPDQAPAHGQHGAGPAGHAGAHGGHAGRHGGNAGHHGGHGGHAHGGGPLVHRFERADDWVPAFEGPERDAWQKPAEVIAAMRLAPGMRVADLGAGTGYFLPHLSRAVGPTGAVIGLDIERDMGRYMEDGRNDARRRSGTDGGGPGRAGAVLPRPPPRALVIDRDIAAHVLAEHGCPDED